MFELKNAGKRFGSRWIFQNLNFQVQTGDFISILGPSGCGKSTLLRILAELDTLTEGQVTQPKTTTPGFVFQESCLLPWLTVYENIAIGISTNTLTPTERSEQIEKILNTVKLKEASRLFPHQLSGGMKMRVSIARALINNKSILFLDEPFAALDDFIRFELQEELLEYWNQHKMTVFFVTHSVTESVFLSQKLWLFPQGDQHQFQELDLRKSEINVRMYRQTSEYFNLVTQISDRLRGKT